MIGRLLTPQTPRRQKKARTGRPDADNPAKRATRGVAELAKDPGAENGPEAGQTQVTLSVPVPAKMLGHHLPQLGDLDVQDVDQLDLG
jgi:hypothetical protein